MVKKLPIVKVKWTSAVLKYHKALTKVEPEGKQVAPSMKSG